jgi:hypothetical protein
MDTIDANRWRTPKLGTLEPNGGPKMGNHMELNGGKFQQTMRGFHLAGFDGHGWVDG